MEMVKKKKKKVIPLLKPNLTMVHIAKMGEKNTKNFGV